MFLSLQTSHVISSLSDQIQTNKKEKVCENSEECVKLDKLLRINVLAHVQKISVAELRPVHTFMALLQ